MTPAARVEAWNRKHPVGTRVEYDGPTWGRKLKFAWTDSEAFVDANGDALVMIEVLTGHQFFARIKDLKTW